MIRVNELRFGNLVSDTHASDTFSAKVNKITDSRVYYGSFHSHPNDLKPIPLTEEWLIKFGIKLMPESEYTMNTYDIAGFKLWRTNGKFLFNDKIEIKYVHHLQNIYFALKNKELELIKE